MVFLQKVPFFPNTQYNAEYSLWIFCFYLKYNDCIFEKFSSLAKEWQCTFPDTKHAQNKDWITESLLQKRKYVI